MTFFDGDQCHMVLQLITSRHVITKFFFLMLHLIAPMNLAMSSFKDRDSDVRQIMVFTI